MTNTNTDEMTHLRALLAEQTARAEKAERTLAEALAKLPTTWGAPDVLHHLLEKAGRCDQAEVRAEHAEREGAKLAARLEGCLERGTAEEARAEKAEAAAEHEHAEMQRQAKLAVDWMLDAKRAEAACAEMRAALLGAREVMTGMIGQEWADAWNAADALLSRPDLGAGKVLVERERLTAWREVLTELAPTCRCDEALTSRGRHEVTALCYMEADTKAAIADLDALLKKGGG